SDLWCRRRVGRGSRPTRGSDLQVAAGGCPAGGDRAPGGSADAYVAVGRVGTRPVRGAAGLAALVPVAGAVGCGVGAAPEVLAAAVALFPGLRRAGEVTAGVRLRGALGAEHYRGGGQGAGPDPLEEVAAAPPPGGGLPVCGCHRRRLLSPEVTVAVRGSSP